MSTTTPVPSQTRSRKVKAVLAGGVVFGIGTAVTIAAWTDQEWATAIFSAGEFGIESSASGAPGTFANHTTSENALVLDFELGGGHNLSPGVPVAAPFVVRVAEGTSYDATVDLADGFSEGDNAAALTYGIVQVDSPASCVPGATGTTIVPTGSALGDVSGATGFSLNAGAGGAAGAPVTLCFQLIGDNTLIQGAGAIGTWQFIATSVEN